jgi:catechol 2,3-dioxygenase-like lactoylglutathione lyase family enzyme
MRDYRFDHIHLRCADPSAMADFFETTFAAEVARDIYPPGTLYPAQQRIRMRVGGQTVLIAPAHPTDAMGAAPTFPYYASSIWASPSTTSMRPARSSRPKAPTSLSAP